MHPAQPGSLAWLARLLPVLALAAMPPAFAHDPTDGGAPLEQHYVPTKHGKLYFEKEGTGPVLVLVAGGPGNGHFNYHHPVFSALAKTHTVVYLDSMGRGKSDRLADQSQYSIEQDAEDVEEVRKYLGAKEISVLGHSYGAMPALEYALRYPANVKKAVLCSSPASGPLWSNGSAERMRFLRQFHPEVMDAVDRLRAKGVPADAPEIAALAAKVPDPSWHNLAEKAKRKIPTLDSDKFNPAVFKAIAGEGSEESLTGSARNYDPFPRAARLKAQVFVCGGRHDFVVPPRTTVTLHQKLPAGLAQLYIFEESAHRPWVEESALYLAKVQEFLAR